MCQRNTGNYSTEEACLHAAESQFQARAYSSLRREFGNRTTGNRVNEKLVTKEKVSNLPITHLPN
jgi:hypothetical protein